MESCGSIEKLLYQKIVLYDEDDTEDFLKCLRLRLMHNEFAKTTTTSLYLEGPLDESTVIELLSLCSGVTCLALSDDTEAFAEDTLLLWRALDALPLMSLTLNMVIDFKPSIGTFNVLKNLTHLDIMDKRILRKNHKGLYGLDSLTHICLPLSVRTSDPAAVMGLISNARLRVLAFRVEDSHERVQLFLQMNGTLDARIVLLPSIMENWDELGRGDMLLWELAEEKVMLPIPHNSAFVLSHIRSSSYKAIYIEGHRCLSLPSIVNGYADYNGDEIESDDESCTTYSIARTKGP
ncbi:hypothetical protein BDR07DRAFT_1308184 [Suillus spraguei]|nr:hypothetical protein BDR07DRAFT_1308184 [Suillus spraguei]